MMLRRERMPARLVKPALYTRPATAVLMSLASLATLAGTSAWADSPAREAGRTSSGRLQWGVGIAVNCLEFRTFRPTRDHTNYVAVGGIGNE